MILANDPQPQQDNELKVLNSPSQIQPTFPHYTNHDTHENVYQFLGFKLLAGFTSVVVSQFLLANTLAKWLFRSIYDKRYYATLLKPEASEKIQWVNGQVKTFIKTTIRYNSIIFGSKILLDEHYAQTIKRNQTYYQSNSILHYKIGALVGLIGYATSIPVAQFESAKVLRKVQTNFSISNSPEPKNYVQRLKMAWSEFLTVESFRRMLNTFNFVSLAGVMVYRTIYFGSYEKLKAKYNHPVNEYLLAPIGCSALAILVLPIDQIKYLQMTTHKDKSLFQIVSEKGFKLWNLPGKKIYYSIVRQSIAMSTFVAGQNLCNYFVRLKKSYE